jgi:hypothetical protein
MKSALVVYESLFGDNRTIARAIAEGVGRHVPAVAVPVGDAPAVIGDDIGLLVVGGPNHATSMPRPSTRQSAVDKQGAHPLPGETGLREWLSTVRPGAPGVVAAAFDTRLGHPKFVTRVDHASRTEEHLLHAHGFRTIAPAEHFYVVAAEGPLADGEEARAGGWGSRLAELAAEALTSPIR